MHTFIATLAMALAMSCPQKVVGQDFRLFFANNISDLTNLDEINQGTAPLNWREVNSHDIAGNQLEVEEVKSMFASPQMKGLAQQRQFWRMRDHCLLCFRIDPMAPTVSMNVRRAGNRVEQTQVANDTYQVEVTDGNGNKGSITVSRYFFVNVCRQDEPTVIRVWRVGDEEHAITFKYFVYDWDDARLYTFQLDSKRQVLDEVYWIDYRLGYTDEEGEYHTTVESLQLSKTAFQSFYVPRDKDLVDVVLRTGRDDDVHRLRLNLRKLHRGVTTDPDFESVKLTPTFRLDKHEDRELVNFNWIGSGLYERYDTLFLTLISDKGKTISKATVNVNSVDINGKATHDPSVRNLGYDYSRKAFRILTHGNPAYIEVLANGYYPSLYKYPGAADPVSHIMDEARCDGQLTLFTMPEGSSTDGIAFSAQHLLSLNDTKRVLVIAGEDHSVCEVLDLDLSLKAEADTISFFPDAGNDWPKIMDNVRVGKYAEMELTFSSPRSQAAGSPTLTATDVATKKEYQSRWPTTEAIYASDYDNMQRDYYFCRYNLVDMMPVNACCKMTLKTGSRTYTRFPYLILAHVDREALREDVENTVKKDVAPDHTNNGTDAMTNSDVKLTIPPSFTLKIDPMNIKQSFVIDILKQTITSTTSLTYGRPKERDGEGNAISKMRQEAAQYFGGYNYEDYGDQKSSFMPGDVAFDEWMMTELDDIFNIDINRIGQGWFGSGKFSFGMGIGGSMFTDEKSLRLKEATGTIGYGLGLAVPNLFDRYIDNPAVKTIVDKIPGFRFGANFEMSAQFDFGVKKLNPKYKFSEYTWNDNFGWFANVSGKIKLGGWLEIGTPPNPLLDLKCGVRAGGKVGLGAGMANRFELSWPDAGIYLMGLVGVEAYASVKLGFLGLSWSGRATATAGGRWFIPNTSHNPFHPDYPYWISDRKKDEENKSAPQLATAFRALPSSTYGDIIISGVGMGANPHFLDDTKVVYDDCASPDDNLDDRIVVLDTDDYTTQAISDTTATAAHHMRSKRAGHEVVVYEQTHQSAAQAHALQAMSRVAAATSIGQQTQIMAKVRRQDGEWKETVVAAADGKVNSRPVVTVQDDGKAACIWQRGDIEVIDPSLPVDSVGNTAMNGYLVLSHYDGNNWSQPINLFPVNKDLSMQRYDLMMRGDTVLVGAAMMEHPLDTTLMSRRFSYASVNTNSGSVSTIEEPLRPTEFFMNRVGRHAVIAMIYEKNDSTRDIYVKAMRMNGQADGQTGSDIGARFCSPSRVKIICDRAAENLNDFAVLWTEMNNTARNDDGTEISTNEVKMMLNASRISFQPTPHVTVPITLGADRDGMLITDYDGFLDDTSIKVVYSLADPESGNTVIMGNEKFFSNSFEYDVAYTRHAQLTHDVIPVNIIVKNTGTSPIKSVCATINGMVFDIPDSYVQPCQRRTFALQYPVEEGFDGYLSTTASVAYDNVFRSRIHPRRAISLTSQQKALPPMHADMEDVELRLIGHSVEDGVNTFLVEITDNSLRHLDRDDAIRVGIYPHPTIIEPITDEAEVIVTPADFQDYGSKRKAYVTVTVSNVHTSQKAYLNLHTFNAAYDGDDPEQAIISNVHSQDNAHYITLLPHEDPTMVEQLRAAPDNSVLSVRQTTGGVVVSGIEKDAHIRVFNAEGFLIVRDRGEGSDVTIPLHHQGVYLLSAGKDMIKFTY